MQTAPHTCAPEISRQLFVSVGANLFGEDLPKIRLGATAALHPLCLLTGQFMQARVTSWCDPAGMSEYGCGKLVTLQSAYKRRLLVLFTLLQRDFSPTVELCVSILVS